MCRLALLLMLVGSAGITQAADSSAGDQVSGDGNAALKYLRAYAALRQAKGMPPDAATLLENYLTAPLDGRAAELAAAAEDGLRELHRGAALRRCDWEVSYQDGPAAATSHRGAARELIAAAGLRARLRFREGRSPEAAEDLLAALTLARHLSLDGSLASPLIADTLEQDLASLLAHHLPRLGATDLGRVAARLDALPVGASFAAALLSHEEVSRDFLIREVRAASGRDDLIKRLAKLPALEARAAEFLDGCGGNAEGIVQCVEQLRPHYRSWARQFRLPPEQFEKEYGTEAAELTKRNPVFRLLTPSVARARWAEAYRQTRRALLRAAIAVQRDGVGALARHPDPCSSTRLRRVGFGFSPGSSSRRNRLPSASDREAGISHRAVYTCPGCWKRRSQPDGPSN